MQYEEALREWGARRIEAHFRDKPVIDRDTVKVDMEFDEGDVCCGGTDPDCYCSLATSPSAKVVISASGLRGWASGKQYQTYRVSIDHSEFDFCTILAEIVESGHGTLHKTVVKEWP